MVACYRDETYAPCGNSAATIAQFLSQVPSYVRTDKLNASSSGHTVSLASRFFSANAKYTQTFSSSPYAHAGIITAFSSSCQDYPVYGTHFPFTYNFFLFRRRYLGIGDINFLSQIKWYQEILGRSSLTLSVSIPSFVQN